MFWYNIGICIFWFVYLHMIRSYRNDWNDAHVLQILEKTDTNKCLSPNFQNLKTFLEFPIMYQGDLRDIFEEMHNKHLYNTQYSALYVCAAGFVDVLEWLYNDIIFEVDPDDEGLMFHAAANGHVHIMMWLYDKGVTTFSSKLMNVAAENGHNTALMWLQHVGGYCTERAERLARRNGHVDTIKWLNQHDCVKKKKELM